MKHDFLLSRLNFRQILGCVQYMPHSNKYELSVSVMHACMNLGFRVDMILNKLIA